MKFIYSLILAQLCFIMTIKAQDFSQYSKGIFVKGKDSMNYRVLLPEHFDSAKTYPVVFFLHGSGENGSDNELQLKNGGSLFLRSDVRKNFPSIVVFPQCSKNSFWSNTKFEKDSTGKTQIIFVKGGKPTKAMHALLKMVNNFLEKPYVSKSQVFVGGLSAGGMGAYEVLRRKPKMFAAAFAICGGDHIGNVYKYRNVPIWIFHGAKDPIVNPQYSKVIADQLKAIGREVKFTMYADAGHNSWDNAFAEPFFLPWLYSHKK
ncbi:MAG: Phospholipase [Pedobacter sp.]|jgi:predicted peptidase|nr:Phospholipase [Pedobacter sp.]